jgi:hypothetical protein
VPGASGEDRRTLPGRHELLRRPAPWRRPAAWLAALVTVGAAGLVAATLFPASAAVGGQPPADAGRADCTTGDDGYCTMTHHFSFNTAPTAVLVTLYGPLEGSGPLPFQLATDAYTEAGFRLRALTTDGSVYKGPVTVSYVAFGAPGAAPSGPATAQWPSMLASGDPRRPEPPRELVAAAGDGQVRLCWQKAVNADGYDLFYRDVTKGEEWTLMPYPIGQLCWTGGSFTNGHTYQLKIRGANLVGEGPDSDVVTVTPQTGATLPAPAPSRSN